MSRRVWSPVGGLLLYQECFAPLSIRNSTCVKQLEINNNIVKLKTRKGKDYGNKNISDGVSVAADERQSRRCDAADRRPAAGFRDGEPDAHSGCGGGACGSSE